MSKKFWEKIEIVDEKELEKINKIIDRKEAKELDRWVKRYGKEGYFWREPKPKKSDWL